jgi:prealbumin domain-containing protein
MRSKGFGREPPLNGLGTQMAHRDGAPGRPTREQESRRGDALPPPARRRLGRVWPLLLVVLAAVLVAVPIAAGAPQPHPGQKIDLKVLLVYSSGTETDYQAWRAALDREGVPYAALQASSVSDAAVADYANNHAFYQAVVQTTDATPVPDSATAALAKLETTFGIRQLSDYVTTAGHGLSFGAGSTQIGKAGSLTAEGALAFPYLKGNVPIDPSAFAYTATPDGTGQFTPLLVDPKNGNSPYVGIYTHPDGRQEMVTTVNSNQFFTNAQLLRHGMLNWVTRGVYLGYQRNYLEMQVDDLFLGDDIWNPATHTTDYDPAHAVRMTGADVTKAVAWSNANHLRIDFVYNGGGSQQFSPNGNDPLLAAVKANKSAFGFINHTWDHPNLDSATSAYIAKEINDNVSWAQAQGLPVRPAELVTGEHSGLANTRPGNPGTIDPPAFATAQAATTTGATLAPGAYDYAVTGTTSHGETVASTTQVTAGAADNSVDLTWEAVVHAAGYKLYRSPAGANTWALIGTVPQPASPFDDNGPVAVSFDDTGAAGTAATLPTSNTAAIDPYAQNPNLIAGLTSANVKYVATDASKSYPQDPSNVGGAQYEAGATFVDGPAQTVPRWPTNVYYNTATQAQQLDEYNWLYNASKGCVPVQGVTTCNNGDVTWAQYVDAQAAGMFGHVMGNDPRPHYFHQTNLAESTQPTGAIMYPVIDALLKRYDDVFKRDVAPLVQLTPTQIGDELARQAKWKADVAANRVSAYLLDGQVHVTTTSAMDVPLTGTTVGDKYAGQTSGWATIAANADSVFKPSDPANTVAPSITGSSQAAGDVLTANPGTWTGTAPISLAYQWQRRDAAGNYVDIPGAIAATYATTAADLGSTLRVAVLGSNWVSAVSQATAATGTVQLTQKVVPYPGGTDNGRFGLSIDGSVKKTDAANGESTPVVMVGAGTHGVGVAAGAGTSLGDYVTAIACKDTAPGHTATRTADGASLPDLAVGEGDQWQCTITATRKAGTIEVTQKVVPSPGQTEPAAFDISIDGVVKKAGARNADTTGAVGVGSGTHSVAEAAAAGTSLGDYVTAIACQDTAPGHTATRTAEGASLSDLAVGEGDQWQCTITATHKPAATSGGSTPPPTTGGGAAPPPASSNPPSSASSQPATRPAIERLTISPGRFAATGRRRGATIAWRVSGNGTLRISIQRAASGRKVRRACRATTRSNSRAKPCTRLVASGAISRAVAKGDGKLRFGARIGGHPLRPGRYRLRATVAGADGARSAAMTARFTVVARTR